MIANQDIRQQAKELGVKLWQVAEHCGLNDGNFSRRLRHELPPEEKVRIRSIISELAKEAG